MFSALLTGFILLIASPPEGLVTDPTDWSASPSDGGSSDVATRIDDDCESFSLDSLAEDEPIPICGETGELLLEGGYSPFTMPGESSENQEVATEWDHASEFQGEMEANVDSEIFQQKGSDDSRIISSWPSLLPPIIAIALALVFRQAYLALFIGVWMGAWLIAGAGIKGVFTSLFTSVTGYIIPSVASPDHISILTFILLIGAMVGLIGANGGTRGVVDAVTRLVTTRKRARITTTAMGYVIFFDDYANTMIVGNTMRPLTDRLKISRAKLAYLVDSTAAPVAIVALISTWIGAVVGYILEASSGIAELEGTSYLIFLHSLPYNFYAFFTIALVLIIAVSGRDFGPMLKAERQASQGRDLTRSNEEASDSVSEIDLNLENGSKGNWLDALLPIISLVFVTIAGLIITGEGSTAREIIGTADSYAALVWGSVASLFLALCLTLSRKILSAEAIMKSMFKGMHVMFEGGIILILAWSLGMVTVHLDTAGFLVSLLEGFLDPYWIPVIMFIIAGFTSFSTGSSWGTMGILTPLVIPLTWSFGSSLGINPAETQTLLYAGVSAVLAGAVWGDHCSPVSDTTILSSLACQCDHIAHVNTQLPYAMVTGVLAIISLIASVIFGLTLWIIYPAMIGILFLIVYRFGTSVDQKD